MSKNKLYRVYCNTESQFIYTLATTEPTECPNNSGHTINVNSISEIDSNPADPSHNGYILTIDSTDPANLCWSKNNYYNEEKTCGLFDDFQGSNLLPIWVSNTQGAGSSVGIVDGVGGQVQLLTDTNTTDYAELTMNNSAIVVACAPHIKIRTKCSDTYDTKIEFGIIYDPSNYIIFKYDATTPVQNWLTLTTSSGITTQNDSGVIGDTNWNVFEIRCSSTTITFYINGTPVATHTTNIPSQLMKFYIRQTTNTTASKNTLLDFVKIHSDRDGTAEGSGEVGSCIII